jgi:N-glycosylase/DNA lyase
MIEYNQQKPQIITEELTEMPGEIVKQVFEYVDDFNLDDIFDCGQCFRWNKQEDGSYTGVVEGAFANVSFKPYPGKRTSGVVEIWSNLHPFSPVRRESFWRNYLDLDRDYGAVKRLLVTEDRIMAKAVAECGGIRILNQDKWETLISFLISQNNNIPRIKGCIEALCAAHGERIGKLRGQPLYAFPTMKKLASLREENLDICKLGYRAKYIVETARQVAYDEGAILGSGERIPTVEIAEYLQRLSGVGPKVANCIMLFSMKKTEVFPIDVWMRRVMNRFYGMGEDNVSAMQDYAARNFGRYGGIAQQYLFKYIRDLKEKNPQMYARYDFERQQEKESPKTEKVSMRA